MSRRSRRRRDARDHGAGDVLALVLIAPVGVALALLVVFLGRQVDARAQVHAAAEAAAQAAALERSTDASTSAAHEVVAAMLGDPDTCASPLVAVDLRSFGPGGQVGVTVTCTVSTRVLTSLGPGARRFTVSAWAGIDPHRAVTGAAP